MHLSQWFIMLCLWLYCISITKKSDASVTVIYHAKSLTVLYQYHYEEWCICHSDLSCYVFDCTVSVSLRRVMHLSQWFIMLCLWLYCICITKKSDASVTVIYHAMSLTVLYQYHYEEWCICHSDLSCYVFDCTVSVSLWRVMHLSQWFIMLCLWLYCICITKKSDASVTVIYHAMSLTVLYQYHYEEWCICHSDLSCYVFDCTVSVSLWRVMHLSQWFIMVCLWLYYVTLISISLCSVLHIK